MKTKLPDGRGFDIVVWQKKAAGETYCAAYSTPGANFLQSWFPEASVHRIYEMGIIHPREFLRDAPTELKIGGISPGAKVPVRINPHLH